jgi:uncharacterized protein
MRLRVTAACLGAAFGFLLAWVGMSDPDAIRRMLLLEEAYLFLVFFSAVAVAFTGVRLVRRAGMRALLTGEPVAWASAKPEPRHVAGSVVFGAGWALSSSCPGPIAAQLGQGMFWSLFTIAGIVLGLMLFARRERVLDRIRGAWMTRQPQGR